MARIGNKKAFTVHLSDEMAAMIDLKRKEWGLRSRGEVIERLLGWMIETKDPIRQSGKQLWTNIVTAMRDAGIGEVTKSKPLTFRRRTDADGHRKMSA